MGANDTLDQRIRSLVAEMAESAPPPPSLPELEWAMTDVRDRRHRRTHRSWLLQLTAMVIVVLVVVGVAAWRTTNHATQKSSTPPARSEPRWRFAASLTGPQFVIATGNPQSIVGATCGTQKLCFLSTGYGLDYIGGGSLYVSHDSGGSWVQAPLPVTTAATTLASCASASWCAVGGGVLDTKTGDPAAKKPSRDPVLLVTSDGGATWSDIAVPIPVSVQQLPAYNGLPAETTYWPGEIDSLSCSAPGQCNVVGHTQSTNPSSPNGDEFVFLRTVDGGAHWTTTVLPETPAESNDQVVVPGGQSVSMACPTALNCVVAASIFPVFLPQGGVVVVWKTTNGGQTWSEHLATGVSTLASFSPISCPTVDECWLVPEGTEGAPGHSIPKILLKSTNGGRTWVQVPLPSFGPPSVPTGFSVYSISCPKSSQCFAAGAVETPEPPDGRQCQVYGGCYGTGALIAATTDSGKSWHLVTLPSGVGAVVNVSCTRGSACVAVASPGGDGLGSIVLTNRAAGRPN